MAKQTWKLQRKLKTAVKKLKFLLSFNLRRWRVASILRSISKRQRRLSFNDRLGLHGCIEGDDDNRNEFVRTLQRTKSCCSSGDDVEDIDRKAEVFIANFHRQLLMERQVSLQVRYYRGNSFSRDY
ncbi:hypothetical protein M5689_012069 [Euphorbia peplus]|nr:hypothetical protein M5689_012069 [Euphorbia peplus]